MRINLFCLPHAGGNGFSYQPLNKVTENSINVKPLDYPGHGNRIREPLSKNITEIADAVFEEIRNSLQTPYAILGHSMGTITGYLLVRRIREEKLPMPRHLFFTGRGAPFVPSSTPTKHSLSKEELLKVLDEMGGMSKEVLQSEDLWNWIEPILRSDLKAVESYQHTTSDPFNIPVTIMLGSRDITKEADADQWQKITTQELELHTIEGGHFFIFESINEIGNIITAKLQSQ